MSESALPPIDYAARVNRLQSAMAKTEADVLAIIPGPNLRYLCGGVHFLLERPLVWFLPRVGEPLAVVPQLESSLFQGHDLPARVLPWSDADGYERAFAAAFAELSLSGKRVLVEGLRMRYFECEILRAAGAVLGAGDTLLSELRMRKDESELAALRRAIRLSEMALGQVLAEIRVGMSEQEIGVRLDALLREVGCEGQSFTTIVHAGGNTAMPHHGPLPYRAKVGDALLFDFGGVYQGYCADITRVFFFGEANPRQRRFYEAVYRANERARQVARPGLACAELDRQTAAVLQEAGWGDLIRHRTGHGLGLEAHEEPYVVAGNERLLEPGMVFTVEPGIYELGKLGVRIEDNILITEEGSESLTTFPRELRVLA